MCVFYVGDQQLSYFESEINHIKSGMYILYAMQYAWMPANRDWLNGSSTFKTDIITISAGFGNINNNKKFYTLTIKENEVVPHLTNW